MYYILLALHNLIYNICPFFLFKKKYLRLTKVKIGFNSYIHTRVKFFSFGNLTIGDNSSINFGCYLDNRNQIIIHNNVAICHNVKIYTLGHDLDDPYFRGMGGPVIINDYAFVFPNVLIMPNVEIGKGAVVLPGSVVTKNIEPYNVVGGVPAKFVRYRINDLKYTINNKYWFSN